MNMRKRLVLTVMLLTINSLLMLAQESGAAYLLEIAEVVKELRKGNNSARNSVVTKLSAQAKITLMDEIKWAGDEEEKVNEVKGAKGNRFRLNQVVAHVYKNQNLQLESKNNMLNGNERDIHYCAIEKSVKKGGKLTYKIRGRSGEQDFMFIPFNPNSKYVVHMYVGEETIREATSDVCHIHLDKVSSDQYIYFSINYLDEKSNKEAVESFAILNYNPQK